MANGDGMSPLLKLAVQVGVPAAIALYLVYSLNTDIARNVRDSVTALREHVTDSKLLERKLDEQQTSLDVLIQIQKFNCLHMAKNSGERAECYEASKR